MLNLKLSVETLSSFIFPITYVIFRTLVYHLSVHKKNILKWQIYLHSKTSKLTQNIRITQQKSFYFSFKSLRLIPFSLYHSSSIPKSSLMWSCNMYQPPVTKQVLIHSSRNAAEPVWSSVDPGHGTTVAGLAWHWLATGSALCLWKVENDTRTTSALLTRGIYSV